MTSLQGSIRALCVSVARGTEKRPVARVNLIENYGLEGDAHAGHWHRQVSLLSADKVDAFNARIDDLNASANEAQATAKRLPSEHVLPGAFGENILVEGIDFRVLPVGTRFYAGSVILELTQIGKECHSHCQIFHRVGDCIMPREGVFATVIRGGELTVGMDMTVELPRADRPFRAAVMTLSDKGSVGERVDTSGPRAAELLTEAGYEVVEQVLLPDVQARIEHELKRLADSRQVDLILTTGGTGMSLRDVTPEATLAVATRNVPGIAEAIRAGSMAITKRAMLSRGVSVMRNRTLIINLPGSKKAVEESLDVILEQLEHGLRLVRGTDGECGRM